MLQETHLHALDRCAVQHRSQFLATARRVLGDSAAAQDAVQDAMLSAAKNLHRFRGDSQLSTWLGRIVINAALTRRRALRRRPEESLDALLERGTARVRRQSRRRGRRRASFASTGTVAGTDAPARRNRSMLRSAVDRLPNDYRTVVILRHYEDHRDRGDCVAAADHAECRETAASARAPRAAQPVGGARVRHHDPIGIGARLGPYEILGPIGRGGMGEVYRARDARLGRDVAIKVLPPDAAQMPDRLPRFEREAQAVAALNHPNILALHDIGNDGRRRLRRHGAARRRDAARAPRAGGTVHAAQGDRLRDPDRARAGRRARARHRAPRSEAREHLHHARRTGEDSRLRPRAAGGGAGRSTGDSRDTRFTTEPGVLLGTPGYIAPEQMLGEPATARSDLFALGIVLHEMLTGAHPFRRGDDRPTRSPPSCARIRRRWTAPCPACRRGSRRSSSGASTSTRPIGRPRRATSDCSSKRPASDSGRLPSGGDDRARRAAARAESHAGDLVRAADPAVDGDLGLRARHGGSGRHRRRSRPT